jgi:class 3 adenylate cyclase/tetratricopeptide (TPR) repeat protein
MASKAADAPLAAAFDNPEAYLPRDRRRALAEGRELPDRVIGSALFADISGFTQLTEALAAELGPQLGAEELAANLHRVFHSIIAELDRFGGDVIYFSGDAITCWIDGDDGLRAAACGLAMRDAMARVGEVRTPGGSVVQLAMKIAVAAGTARRFVVGDPEIQLIDVLAGRLVDDLAAAEHLAEQGEVVLDQSALEFLSTRAEISERRRDDESGRIVGVLDVLTEPVPDAPAPEPERPLPEELVRPWLLPPVYERLRTGRGEFLTELRPAIPVFVRFTGIDYDADDDAIAKLDDFIRRAQRVFADCGGNLLQLTLGDKGAYLYAVFGSPHAHEDDAARAASAGLYLLALEGVTSARDLQVGIAHGRLRSGTYGHDMRRTFVCLGDAVNLAARLMSRAPIGEIYVAEAVRDQAGEAFAWEQLPEITVKGKADPVAVYGLRGLGDAPAKRQRRYDLPIVGRRAELDALGEGLDRAREGQGSVIGIAAEAGVGKSRLVAEFVREARAHGVRVAFGECQAFGTNTSYRVWQEIWRTLLGVDDDLEEDEQRTLVEGALAALDPALLSRAPLLGAVLQIPIPDNELTRGLDAELRKTSLESLLAEALRRLASRPLVLVLEDCHWIDSLSRDLLEVLARAVSTLPVLVVLAYRPATEVGGGLGLERLSRFTELPLPDLEPDDAEQLIRMRLEPVLGPEGVPPPALVELVTTRSQGNPFYIEELLNYVQGQGVDFADERALAELQVPESLHSLVLSRIDTLTEEPRRTLKVASVMGRTFYARALPEVYPEVGSLGRVREHLGALQAADLVRLDREDEEAYIFKHVVTRDVAYESMPFALRALLHESAGDYLETSEADALDRNLDLLAYHYWNSRNDAKKRHYLVQAGEAAKSRFANASAVDYFERALPLLEGADRWTVTRGLGEALEVSGDTARAEEAYSDALELARASGTRADTGWTETSLAELARKKGDYGAASDWLDAAELEFEAAGDRPGFGRVEHIRGVLANIRGDREEARRHMEASLEIRREANDKVAMGALYSNLAIVAEYEGDYDRSVELFEESLALRTEAGDTAGIAVSQMNLGVMLQRLGRLEEGRERQEASLDVRREIGDPRMIALGEHNLGILMRELGDYDRSRELFGSALRVQRDQQDTWALAFMLEDVAVLATLLEEHELALRLAGAADAVREQTQAKHGVKTQAELDAQLAPARVALGAAADAVWEEGRAGGLDEAIQWALEYCETRRPSGPG